MQGHSLNVAVPSVNTSRATSKYSAAQFWLLINSLSAAMTFTSKEKQHALSRPPRRPLDSPAIPRSLC